MSEGLLEDLDVAFGTSPRMEILRGIEPGDLPHLHSQPATVPTLASVNANHHRLAQLIVQGTMTLVEMSALTGYTPVYISRLKNDPTFQELMANYELGREQIFVDVMERMKVLGLSAVEDLQEKLEAGKLTTQQVIDIAEMAIVKARRAEAQGGSAAPGPVQINVNFREAVGAGQIIESTQVERIEG